MHGTDREARTSIHLYDSTHHLPESFNTSLMSRTSRCEKAELMSIGTKASGDSSDTADEVKDCTGVLRLPEGGRHFSPDPHLHGKNIIPGHEFQPFGNFWTGQA